jgi:hypothetical protein
MLAPGLARRASPIALPTGRLITPLDRADARRAAFLIAATERSAPRVVDRGMITLAP